MTGSNNLELGTRVRRYRELAGLSQEAVARVLGIPRSGVSLLESGKRDISAVELHRLADLLGVHPQQLFTEGPSAGTSLPSLTSSSVRFRAQLADVEREHQVEAWLADVQQKVSQAERILGLAADTGEDLTVPAVRRLPRDYSDRMSGLSPVRQGEEAAALERIRLALGDAPIDDLSALLGRQGVLVWGRLSEADPPLDGLSFFDGAGRPMIFHFSRSDRVALASYRWRFTIAHELGHLLFDFPSYERNAVADVEVVTAGGAVPEQRANAFAAALLMPREGLRSELEQLGWKFGQPINPHWLLHLQLMFRVSYTALGFRLVNLGWLGPDSWEQLSRVQPQVAAAVLGLDPYSALPQFQASSSGWVVPAQLTSLALRAFQNQQVSLEVLAEFMDMDVADARRLTRELQIAPGSLAADVEALRHRKPAQS